MNTLEKGPEIIKSMPCDKSDKSLIELQSEGWADSWSFHTRLTDQWNQACDKARTLQNEGYDVVLVNDPGEAEKEDGIAYLYSKKKSE